MTATTETTSQPTTTSPAGALVERVGHEAGEDSQPVHMRRIAALITEYENTTTSDAIAEARRMHLEKLTKVKDAVIKVAPRTDATTRPLTGRWGGHHARRRSKERQVDDAWVRANSGRKRGFLSADASDDAPQIMLVETALKGHVAAIGDCRGAFYQSPFEPRRNRKPSLDRSASRGRAGTGLHMGSRVSIPGLKGASRA